MTPHTIVASDGYALAARRFAPSGEVKASVLVPAAMGVKQDFYVAFARFLAARGYAVTTFDYRGIGASAPARLRGFTTDIMTWARLDYDAALCDAKAWHESRPLFVVGHSLAGQLAGIVPSGHLIDALLTVACGSGYWRENAPALKRVAWWLWYVLVPLTIPIAGYFPGKRLRKVGDVPAGAMRQWSRWCRHRDYAVGVEGEAVRAAFASVRFPILSLSFTDDDYMSARNVESIHSFYTGAPKEMRRLAPHDVGLTSVGHFGFFREAARMPLWEQAEAWLAARL